MKEEHSSEGRLLLIRSLTQEMTEVFALASTIKIKITKKQMTFGAYLTLNTASNKQEHLDFCEELKTQVSAISVTATGNKPGLLEKKSTLLVSKVVSRY